ncbi:hypothetical protein AX15_006607 [Amanita polypyramis BW_CC]|nr:hypothetical protein AX15_006607 [Amanita polypyramis BW_CC]
MSNPIPSVITSFHDSAFIENRPTTPPNTNVVPEGTPLTGKQASSLPFTSTHIMRDERVTAMRYEITGRVVGPVPAQEFLDHYLPSASVPPLPDHKGLITKLAEMSKVEKEMQMYDLWNETFNCFCEPGSLKLHNVATRAAPDFYEREIKPDLGLYSTELGSKLKTNDIIVEEAEMLHERKYDSSDDAFQDDGPFERDTSAACDTLGQIALYATAHMTAQFCTHVFSLLIFPKYARLLRWDRAGVVVTKRIPVAESALAEFYWRYSHASPAVRGRDTSVERVLDRVKAKTVREMLELDENCKLFRLKLGENGYIVGKKPTYMGISSPTGRSTRTFRAFCEQDEKVVFLKDTWRVIIAAQLPEHQIYLRLHAKKVRNIAQLKEGADVLTHKTITHEAADMFPDKDFPKIRKFRHYRLALDDIGRDLRAFSSVKEFVKAIHDATIAHGDAFFEAEILHRDISVGNIVISNNGTGLLIDWDLCKIMNPESENEEHAVERTGTWQFAAARLLLGNSNEPPHNHEDDLESFYHVLNWMALRHTSHSLNSQTLTSELQRIFDYSYRLQGGTAAGGRAKRDALLSGGTNKEAKFQNLLLAKLLETIRKLVAIRYQDEPDSEAEQVDINRYQSLCSQGIKTGM